jgi:hypothetical protein
MANIFQIKRRTTGDAGAPGSLQNGELAYNEVNDTLYYGAANGIRAIGGSGSYVTLGSSQTVDASKTFAGSVDLGSSAVTVTQSTTDSSAAVANTEFVQNVASLLDGGTF